MSSFTPLQKAWKDVIEKNPDSVQEFRDTVVPMLVSGDSASIKQGLELLCATGKASLCFLLEERAGDIHMSSLPGLQSWTSKELKAVLQNFSLKTSGKKSELVERINTSRFIRREIEKNIIQMLASGDSDLADLYSSESCNVMLLRSTGEGSWNGESIDLQHRIFEEVRQMKEIHSAEARFAIGKYPVTQVFWERVMDHNPSAFKGHSRPVERVSWVDCMLFCNRLSEREHLDKVYSLPSGWEQGLALSKSGMDAELHELCKRVTQNKEANGYRLPSEKEWLVAGHANQDVVYAGSNNINEVAWYKENSGGQTRGVGQKNPNEFGLYDMSGNVFEWCWDVVRAHPKGQRVFRGGSVRSGEKYTRLSDRMFNFPSLQGDYIGFRLCRTIL